MPNEVVRFSDNNSIDDPIRIPASRGGFSLKYKERTLLSTIDPAGQAEKAAAGIEQKNRTLYLCPSPLFGYGLDSFLADMAGDSALLCVETDKKLLALSRASIGVLNHPRCMLTGESSEEKLCSLVRAKWGGRAFRRTVTMRLNGGWQLDAERYARLEKALENCLAREWGNAMTLIKLGRRYLRNALRNLAALSHVHSLDELTFGRMPVLVLGAGPSLDEFLELLVPQLQERRPFKILCADTCILSLLERNIKPDLAVILESQHWNLGDFIGAGNTKIPAAVDLSAYPASADILGGPVYFFFTPWTSLRLFERLNAAGLLPPSLPPLGSVGLSAAEIARRLSSGPVVAAGIDFSFTLDKSHARSSPFHLSILRNAGRFQSMINPAAFGKGVVPAVAKSGAAVLTNPAMKTYRALWEEEFSGDQRLYEVSGSGLPLGLRTVSPREAAEILFRGGEQPAGEKSRKESAALGPFVRAECKKLGELRDILALGTKTEKLDTLLDELDYLWAHFPDCAAKTGGRPPVSDTGFLKRVRTEIDPCLKLWAIAYRESSC
jgi:hypothetical protein